MNDDVHPLKCPNCETTIRATNVEYLHDDNVVVASDVHTFSLTDKRRLSNGEQLYYCPNDDCRIVRLFPAERDSE